MMRDGFVPAGVSVKIAAALIVSANPADSPVSTAWDPRSIACVRVYEGEYGSTQWLDQLASDPSQLFTSDGDPDSLTVRIYFHRRVLEPSIRKEQPVTERRSFGLIPQREWHPDHQAVGSEGAETDRRHRQESWLPCKPQPKNG